MKILIKKYVMDESLSWEERYQQLEAHHKEETEWMMDMLQKQEAEIKDSAIVTAGLYERVKKLENN
jgi:hypothetical protein